MEYKTHNNAQINPTGTHLQGYLNAGYNELVRAFGYPQGSDGYKVDAEWTIKFSSGEVATVYNWKNGINYCGASGLHASQITHWHIGGFSEEVVDLVKSALGQDQ